MRNVTISSWRLRGQRDDTYQHQLARNGVISLAAQDRTMRSVFRSVGAEDLKSSWSTAIYLARSSLRADRGVTTCRATRGLTGSSARAPDDVAATVVAAFVRSSARRILLIALPRPRGTRLEGLLSRCYLGSAWAYQSPLHPKHAPFESNSTLRRPSSTHVSVFTNPLTPLIDLIIFSCP